MTDFSGAVREALAAIPHTDECEHGRVWCDKCCDWYPASSAHGHGAKEFGPCTCDREERIAQRVAEALEVAYTSGNGYPPGTLVELESAIAALSGTTPKDEP